MWVQPYVCSSLHLNASTRFSFGCRPSSSGSTTMPCNHEMSMQRRDSIQVPWLQEAQHSSCLGLCVHVTRGGHESRHIPYTPCVTVPSYPSQCALHATQVPMQAASHSAVLFQEVECVSAYRVGGPLTHCLTGRLKEPAAEGACNPGEAGRLLRPKATQCGLEPCRKLRRCKSDHSESLEVSE